MKVPDTVAKAVSYALLCILLVTPVLAAGNPAMLHPSGSVLLNGGRVLRSSAIFTGDKVQTGSNSLANIAGLRSLVLVAADSSLVFESSAVQLESGSARITTANGLAARVGRFKISAKDESSSTFDLSLQDGKPRIVALRGSVTVTDGAEHRLVLHEGETLSIDSGSDHPSDATPPVRYARLHLGAGAAVGVGVAVAAVAATMAAVTTKHVSEVRP